MNTKFDGDIMTATIRIVLLAVALALTSSASFARGSGHSGGHGSSHASSGGSHRISGYTKKSGTHVAPAHATNPNKTKRDNYSSKGNVNPYTGKAGTKDPNARTK
jgi:hypothetical protein